MEGGKLRKISYIRKEIVIQPNVSTYEINGIVSSNMMFLYRAKQSTYIEMAKGDYRIEGDINNQTLRIVNNEILKHEKIQVVNSFDFKASIYETDFNVDINTLKNKYNELCQSTFNLWEIFRQQGIVGDSIGVDLIFPEIKHGEVFIRVDDHYEGISLTDAELKIKQNY